MLDLFPFRGEVTEALDLLGLSGRANFNQYTTYVTTTADIYISEIKVFQWTVTGPTDLELNTQLSEPAQ
jgi:hypothetical protein